MKKKTIAIIGTIDTKENDYRFLKGWIEALGAATLVINTGIMDKPDMQVDVSAEEVAVAGGTSCEQLRKAGDFQKSIEVMSKGSAIIVKELYERKKINSIVSVGGSNNTLISTSAMRALPIGVPKLMVTTLAPGDTRPYVQDSDIIMMPSVVNVSGLNLVSRRIYMNAAASIVAMTKSIMDLEIKDRPCIATTIFGVTTPCVNHAKRLLEKAGYEVLVFHALGTGGRNMEKLVRELPIKGILDITTTELADEIVGGCFSAGSDRLEAAGEMGIPQVICPGALDMVNFGPPETVPAKYKDRNFYQWRPMHTLMRTNTKENDQLGKIIADKLNKSKGPVSFVVPKKGFSGLDMGGRPFYDPEADSSLRNAIKSGLNKQSRFVEYDDHINDERFAEKITNLLLKELKDFA